MGDVSRNRRRNARLPLALALAGMLIGVLALGCGGDDGNGASPSGTTNTPAAGGSGASGPGNGANGAPAALESPDSFRFSVTMSGHGGAFEGLGAPDAGSEDAVYEVEGAFIRPDRLQISSSLAGLEFGTTIIGDQRWTTVGGQTDGPVTAEPLEIEESLMILDVWDDSEVTGREDDLSCGESESINGVEARRCSLSEEVQGDLTGSMSEFFGADVSQFSTYDVWLSEAGIPVRLVIEVEGSDDAGEFSNRIEMNVTDINGDFSIEEPQ